MPVRRTGIAITCLLMSPLLVGQIRAESRFVQSKTLSFHSDPADPAYGAVDFRPSSAETMAELRRLAAADAFQTWFRVVVDDAETFGPDMPAIAGRYQILADRVRFTPLFPPQPGVRYRAIADFPNILQYAAPTSATLEFVAAASSAGPATVVKRIYPTAAVLPTNLLRFYVWFSAPMQQGYVPDHVFLLGPDGKADPAAFFPSQKELWDPSMQRLTVLLDPGRIKRGVGPNLKLGPPLDEGGLYTLKISAGMVDAHGLPLQTSYSKTFRVSEADRSSIDPRQWRIRRPPLGTRKPLIVLAPTPLDQALFARTVRLLRADDSPVAGDTHIDRDETRWSFVPESAWTAGSYVLEVDPSLEDVAGNTIWAPFDVVGGETGTSAGPTGPIDLPIIIGAH